MTPTLRATLRNLALLAALAAGFAPAQAAPVLVSFDGRTLEVQESHAANATATVVFENGSKETLDTWSAVLRGLPADVSTFTYNRAGYGRSTASDGPHDGQAIVDGLRRLLRARGFAPPYLLVGHSLGGLYMQLFAREHPDEVRGLVLVDALYPGIVKKPEDFPLYTRLAKHLFFSASVEGEIDRIHDTGDEVLALPSPDQLPIVQLFNVPKSGTAIAVDFGTTDDSPATVGRAKAMYPRAQKRFVDSDHRIQTANPEFVVQAIDGMLGEKQAGR